MSKSREPQIRYWAVLRSDKISTVYHKLQSHTAIAYNEWGFVFLHKKRVSLPDILVCKPQIYCGYFILVKLAFNLYYRPLEPELPVDITSVQQVLCTLAPWLTSC